jgi:hypothetical protein
MTAKTLRRSRGKHAETGVWHMIDRSAWALSAVHGGGFFA